MQLALLRRSSALALAGVLLVGCAAVPGHRWAPTPGLPIPVVPADFKGDVQACGGSTETSWRLLPGGLLGAAALLAYIPADLWDRARVRRCMEARGWQVVGTNWFPDPPEADPIVENLPSRSQ